MSNIVERLDEIIAKNVALEISGMSEAIKAHYRAAFCAEAADTIQRLQAENEEHRKAQPYVYIGKDGKSVLARDLEDRLLKAEAELSSAKEAHLSILKEERAYARAEALEEAAKVADDNAGAYEEDTRDVRNSASDKRISAAVAARLKGVAAAIRRLKEGATPGPVPSLAKLFDDMAAKQRSINDQFEEFMSDVEDGKP